MQNTLSLQSFQGPLWPEVVASKRVLSIGQIELFDNLNGLQTNDLWKIELFEIELFNHLIMCKQMTDV